MPTPNQHVEAKVEVSTEQIKAVIVDRRPDVLETFELPPEQQTQLAVEAWSIGVRALRAAYSQAQESRLSDIGKTLKEDLSQVLNAAVENQHQQMTRELQKYLDPNNGEFGRRLEKFIEGDGELARVLAQFVAPDNSVLAETLATQLGEQSALFKKLSPTDSEGLVQTLKGQLTAVMMQSQTEFHRAMDPLAPDSPVGRFLSSLKADLKKADSDRSLQMTAAMKALDSNDPNSLVSNLARQSRDASQMLLTAMNPANANSPLALLKTSLTELLEQHIKSSKQLMAEQEARQQKFDKDLREVVIRLETHKAANNNAPRGGVDFEDLVAGELQDYLRGGPYICAQTGNVVGIRESCKVGDLVIRFTAESAWAGSTIAFECKQDATYRVDKALKELDVARSNREASVGVFVMASSHAPTDFPIFSRHGHNILVTWDPEDESTLPRLHAAVMLSLALASRKHQVKDTASLDAIKGIETVLTDQLTRIEKMRKASDAIKKHNETLRKELDKADGELQDLVEKAGETLRALDVGRDDEAAERVEPIAFDANDGNDEKSSPAA